jgi:hypothetical protein
MLAGFIGFEVIRRVITDRMLKMFKVSGPKKS